LVVNVFQVTLEVTLTNYQMKITKKRQPRTELRNGCSRTQFFVSPTDYLSLKSKADLQTEWYVECRFYDPEFSESKPNGKQFRRRVDKFTTLQERKAAVKILIEEMEDVLDNQHYTPITESFMSDITGCLTPKTDFKTAIFEGQKKLIASEKYLKNINWAMIRFCKGLDDLKFSYINISEVKIYHIKNTLEKLDLPAYSFNVYRKFLLAIFKELIQYGCINNNPVREISKKKFEVKQRKILSDKKLRIVFNYLRNNYPDFFRYGKIFFYSGARSAELLRVQKKHVNIENQEYSLQIQKGKVFKWVVKVISDDALPYWNEVLSLCKTDEDFLFAKFQRPGLTPNSPNSITQRWYKVVKKKKIYDEDGTEYTVDEDFYSLKYLFLEKLDEMQNLGKVIPIDFNIAQSAADHTTNKTTGIYATGRKKRENEVLKRVSIGI
jgi:integrase